MKFIAVEFNSDLCEYAVLALDKVLDNNLRTLKNDIVGRKAMVLWGKKSFSVKVRGYGTKAAMDGLCDELAEAAASKTDDINVCKGDQQNAIPTKSECKSRSLTDENPGVLAKRPRLSETWKQITVKGHFKSNWSKASDQPTEIDVENKTEGRESNEINELKDKIQKLKQCVRKYKARAIELKRLYIKLEEEKNLATSEADVELMTGSGVYLKKSVVAAAKLTSKTPPILARRLFLQVFKIEDIKGHSLFGRKCNANKNSKSLPLVTEMKRDAVIEFALTAFNVKPSSKNGGIKGICIYSVHKKKIIDSLSKLLREVNKMG